MAWVTPRTWTVGEVVTAAKLNEVRDSLIDLDRRTSPVQSYVATLQGTTSVSYTDLATVGPAVTVTIGSTGKALVGIYAAYSNPSGNFALMAFAVSGATTVAATDTACLQANVTSDVRNGAVVIQSGLNAGSTTFTAKYKATGGTANFNGRTLWVTPLGS